MLHLFVGLANNELMTERALIEKAGANENAGRRWIEHLVKDGQVAKRQDDDDVILTTDAIIQLRRFLDEVLNRGDTPVRG